MNVLGIHTGSHDASACLFRDFELVAAVSLERLTRVKNDGVSMANPLPEAAIDEVLAIGGLARDEIDVVAASRALFEPRDFALRGLAGLEQVWRHAQGKTDLRLLDRMMRKAGVTEAARVFRSDAFLARHGFSRARLHFYNHHLAHGLPAFFYGGFARALIHTADGMGDGVAYSARTAGPEGIGLVFGGDEGLLGRKQVDSLGLLYSGFTHALGYIPNRHEGKLVGLAARGTPVGVERILAAFRVEADGRIRADFGRNREIGEFAADICRSLEPADAAATVQEAVERLMLQSIGALLAHTGLTHLAAGGGVYANVKLNRRLADELAEAMFIFPAMGDEGLPIGGCLDFLMQSRGFPVWYGERRPLASICLGRDHRADPEALAAIYPTLRLSPLRAEADVIEAIVDALVAGKAVGVHEGRMEFGPRALGARSIIASPARREINDSLNARLSRSDFMPFAPVALAERAHDVFDLKPGVAQAAHFMTITCEVRPAWRDRIPAVVHVDGSARPQLVEREPCTFYRRILEAWDQRTGVPVLVNTSFNVHEEPIVDTPQQALNALDADRVDLLLLNGRIFERV